MKKQQVYQNFLRAGGAKLRILAGCCWGQLQAKFGPNIVLYKGKNVLYKIKINLNASPLKNFEFTGLILGGKVS